MNVHLSTRAIGLLFIFLIVSSLAACGGGGDSSPSSKASSAPATEPPTQTTPTPDNEDKRDTAALSGRAIDGYVGGATVFVDLNWNLTADEGEPSTVTDKDGSFRFSKEDIEKYPCYAERPLVVEVPEGATDSTRGAVDSPYTLVYLPMRENKSPGDDINVTPFTTLFATVIATAKTYLDVQEEIHVSEGCGDVADAVFDKAKKDFLVIKQTLFKESGISLDTFYEDFIKNGDEEMSRRASRLADYFKALYSLNSEYVEQFADKYGTDADVYPYPNKDEVIDILSGNSSGQTIPFSISVYAASEGQFDGGWKLWDSAYAEHLFLAKGKYLLDWRCAEGFVGSCDYKPVSLKNIPGTAKEYRDDQVWHKTDDATGYNMRLDTLSGVRWHKDASDYECSVTHEFSASDEPARSYTYDDSKNPNDITEAQLADAGYYEENLASPPTECHRESFQGITAYRTEIVPKITQYDFYSITVYYTFDLDTVDTSMIAGLRSLMNYDSKKDFDSASATQTLIDIPWSPANLDDMYDAMQSGDSFTIYLDGDNYEAVYESSGRCDLYSIDGDDEEDKTLISSVDDKIKAAKQMCFGNLSRWPS
jgi:hypothetical protein